LEKQILLLLQISTLLMVKFSNFTTMGREIYSYTKNVCTMYHTIRATKVPAYYNLNVYPFRYRLWRGVLNTTLCDKVFQWLTTGWWFSPGSPVSSTNKTDCHDITEILLKVVLNIITTTMGREIYSYTKNVCTMYHTIRATKVPAYYNLNVYPFRYHSFFGGK
jgi:hypothetical protein